MQGSVVFGESEYWEQLVQRDPTLALDRIAEAIRSTVLSRTVQSYAWRAAARSLLDLGRLADAGIAAERALAASEAAEPGVREVVTMSASAIIAEAGDFERAVTMLDRLASGATGEVLGRVKLQTACVLMPAGRLVEALALLDEAEFLLEVRTANIDAFRVVFNRGFALLQLGRLEDADRDFERAGEIAAELEMTAAVAQCHANRGVLHGRARRLVVAIDHFAAAERAFAACGNPARAVCGMEIDRAEVMMHSGLLADAVDAAGRALATAVASDNAMLIGDALLMHARTLLAAGHRREARRSADAASTLFERTGRADMTTHASTVAAHAELEQAGSDTAREASAAAAALTLRLRELGWHQQADELAVARIRTAWRSGHWASVAGEIENLRLHAFGDRRDLTLVGWFAEAIARERAGDSAGSIDACVRGLDVLDDITAEATNLEERSAAMRLGHDLSRWIIEVAVGRHEPDIVLAASEGTRARALHDELGGREPHQSLTEEGAKRLRTELRARLGERSLVQWVVAGGRVHAVVFDRGGSRLIDVADLRHVIRERDRVMMWLDRAAAEPDASSARAFRAASIVDDLLISPLGLPSGVDVVIIPVDELHGVAWSGLPTLAERSVVLSPSCRLWLDADRRAGAAVRTVGFVSGPNVVAGEIERDAVERSYAHLDRAGGATASARTVRSMFGAYDLVHVAAHGRFRADRPLLSTIELAEGPVTLHDAIPERVHTRLAVLSSCEGGAHLGLGGSEVLGLAAVLLARGAAAVVAPLTVVRDLECGEFVSAVHEELASGVTIGVAVSRVRAAWLRGDDLSRWAVASSFACFGSGSVAVASS